MTLTTPVAFFIFNRPQLTQRVFNAIRQAKPTMLLVVADGPRCDRPGEADLCAQTRAVIQQVDWPCQVLTNFSDVNLGCKRRVSSGLDWVFETVEEAIVLEDDCLPHPTFFRFCEELLEHYRYDERIMAISGDNFQFGRQRTQDSYYFSHYNHIWGWATWRRAWRYYDVEMKLWSMIKQGNWLQDLLENDQAIRYWSDAFEAVANNRLDTWDFQWTFACWIQHGLSILPNSNLVSNIGFHSDATHTKDANSRVSNLSSKAIQFPLKHPQFIIRNTSADQSTQRLLFPNSRLVKLKQNIKKALNIVSIQL